MQQNEMIRILVVDDHPFVLEGIRSCLGSREGIELVGEATNGKEAVEMAARLSPDVVVMDISMPLMDGLEATRFLRKAAPAAKVLILTVHDQSELAGPIIESGARGYLSKNSPPAELVRAIQSVHRGETYFRPMLTDDQWRKHVGLSNGSASRTATLSLREREVLTLIADGHSNKEAASLLGVSVRTIEKHRERIMDKLKLHSVVALTKYAIAHHMVQVDCQR